MVFPYGSTSAQIFCGRCRNPQLHSGFGAPAHGPVNQLQWGTELFGPLLLTEEILAEPLNYSNFELQIPQGPGLGIVLDEDRVQYFRRDRTQVSVGSAA